MLCRIYPAEQFVTSCKNAPFVAMPLAPSSALAPSGEKTLSLCRDMNLGRRSYIRRFVVATCCLGCCVLMISWFMRNRCIVLHANAWLSAVADPRRLSGARTLLGAPGLTSSNKKLVETSALLLGARTLLGAPGLTTRSKEATRGYKRVHSSLPKFFSHPPTVSPSSVGGHGTLAERMKCPPICTVMGRRSKFGTVYSYLFLDLCFFCIVCFFIRSFI